ncbi:hypothetical protein GCM10022224_030140 [Nonomuraea antimicrobica]|uniref:Uncharacterized protein n=1 Tax=Nonomuraea antimicrobica TaxID=561173 RepID=A0ABP7BNN2_9ACTN
MLALIKAMPGNISLESMLREIDKLTAIRAIGVTREPVRGRGTEGAGVLAGAGCGRVAVASEAPCAQFAGVRGDVAAALLVKREREVTDAPADLLIATVHRKPLIVRVLPVCVCPSQCSRRHLSRGFGAAPPPRGAEGP